jgi:hypothetical protein
MNHDIISLCLYQSYDGNNSYIGLADEKGNCNTRPGVNFVAKFYGINPAISIQPPGSELFCARDTEDATFSTTEIVPLYDTFNYDEKNCIRFIAWMEPVPGTTPLYVFQMNDSVFASFDSTPPSLVHVSKNPIYVLTDPRDGFKTVGNGSPFKIVNDKPVFLFRGYQGRCVPSSEGYTIGECLVLSAKNILSPTFYNTEPTLLGELSKSSKSSKNILMFLTIILLGIFTYGLFKKVKL